MTVISDLIRMSGPEEELNDALVEFGLEDVLQLCKDSELYEDENKRFKARRARR